MDRLAAAEEQIAQQRLRQKLNEVNEASQKHLAPIHDYVNFTLQKAYFKCAYECFDRSRRTEEITSCIENCYIPVSNAHQWCDSEVAKFQEKLNRSLMVCQDKFEAAKLQKKTGAVNDLVSCTDESIEDHIKMLPHLTGKLRASLGVNSDKNL